MPAAASVVTFWSPRGKGIDTVRAAVGARTAWGVTRPAIEVCAAVGGTDVAGFAGDAAAGADTAPARAVSAPGVAGIPSRFARDGAGGTDVSNGASDSAGEPCVAAGPVIAIFSAMDTGCGKGVVGRSISVAGAAAAAEARRTLPCGAGVPSGGAALSLSIQGRAKAVKLPGRPSTGKMLPAASRPSSSSRARRGRWSRVRERRAGRGEGPAFTARLRREGG